MSDLNRIENLHDIQRLLIQDLQAKLTAAQDTIDLARRLISKADVVIVSVEDALRKGYVLPVAADMIRRAIDEYNEVE